MRPVRRGPVLIERLKIDLDLGQAAAANEDRLGRKRSCRQQEGETAARNGAPQGA